MRSRLALRAAAVWLLIACLAVGNGLLREELLVPTLGVATALPISGLLLSLIVFAVTFICFGFLGRQNTRGYLLIGCQWVIMTLAFEFLLGHYLARKSWTEIAATLNPSDGDLFLLVLIVSLLSPCAVSRLRRARQ